MTEIFFDENSAKANVYWNRSQFVSLDAQLEAQTNSSTLYIGNLSFLTSEWQIFDYFSQIGDIKRIIMGLNRQDHAPCGFCFIEYFEVSIARSAVALLNGTFLGGRAIKIEMDAGYVPGRQYGRGKNGGQIRDEKRKDYDADRGGLVKTNTKSSYQKYSSRGQGQASNYKRNNDNDQTRPKRRDDDFYQGKRFRSRSRDR